MRIGRFFRLVAFLSAAFTMIGGRACARAHSFSADSLLFPTEAYVIEKDELSRYNINTLDDLIGILPGVVGWRAGPPGSRSGFSVCGRSQTGITLLVNGIPCRDPYTYESLARFLPLSGLRRVEVLYSCSPIFTGLVSSNGIVNLVIEDEDGRRPSADLDFIYGRSNRRARRGRFSTPRARFRAALAYDEYLQDASESYRPLPTRLLGDYDMRSILMQFSLEGPRDEGLTVTLHRYEDTYLGTPYSSGEDVRGDGFDSRLEYRRGRLNVSVWQRGLSVSRRAGKTSGHVLAGSAGWAAKVHGAEIRLFTSAERAVFENKIWGVRFEPDYSSFEGGLAAGGKAANGLIWRAGVSGVRHGTAGGHMCGELGIGRSWGKNFSHSILVSRSLRRPSPRELFQPRLPATVEGEAAATEGSILLGPEIADELALGAVIYRSFLLDLFMRRERSRIILTGSDPATYRAEGSGEVLGIRGSYKRLGEIIGIGFGLFLSMELFEERSDWTPGIPDYRLLSRLHLERRFFGDTELVSINWDTEVVGDRMWEGAELGAYSVNNLSASVTVLGARVRFQLRNIFDTKYETVPSFFMPERFYVIGVQWKLRD